jgi:hypothetical protein
VLGVALGHHTCVDCKKQSPQTELTYSLLTLAGWRELQIDDGKGGTISEWRCPQCWAVHKRAARVRTQINLPTIKRRE